MASMTTVRLYRGGPSWRNEEGDEVAKGTWFGRTVEHSVVDHVQKNPWDSPWVSLTSDVTVACYFAISQKEPPDQNKRMHNVSE